MKKIVISFAVLAVAAAATVAMVSRSNSDLLFEANVEALTGSENSVGCTGPKRANLYGQVFCRCTNENPCKDESGC